MKIFVASAAIAVTAGAAAAQDYTMRMAHQLPPNHYLSLEYEEWASDIEEKSDGRISVEIFPAAQAFKPDQVFPAVAQGRIEAGMTLSFQWGNTIPEMSVMTVPYVLSSQEDARDFTTSEASGILEELVASKGVEHLTWVFMGNTTVYMSNESPIVEIEDLDGLRIRGLDKVYDAGLEAAGAEAVIMPGSEVYQSLQTGIVDAAVADLLGIGSRKYHEVQDYATVAGTNTVFAHIIVNPDWYNGLDDQARAALDEASEALQTRMIDKFPDRADAAWAEVEGLIELREQTEEEAARWAEVLQPASIEEFLAAAPENGQRLLDAIRAMKD